MRFSYDHLRDCIVVTVHDATDGFNIPLPAEMTIDRMEKYVKEIELFWS